MFFLLSLTKALASSRLIPFSIIKNAITMQEERDTPIWQCTNTLVFCRLLFMYSQLDYNSGNMVVYSASSSSNFILLQTDILAFSRISLTLNLGYAQSSRMVRTQSICFSFINAISLIALTPPRKRFPFSGVFS